MTIPIAFRHPHSLRAERPHQKTALLQAGYSFVASRTRSCSDSLHQDTNIFFATSSASRSGDDVSHAGDGVYENSPRKAERISHYIPVSYHQRDLERQNNGMTMATVSRESTMSNQSDDRKRQVLNNVSLELHQHAGASPRRELTHEKISNHNQAVVAWELQVKKGVTLPAFSRNLFTQWLQQPDVDLLQLQNRCASPLLFGRMNADWVPENSFSWSQVQPVQDQLQAADVYPSWQIAGQQRPLFIEKKPRPFTIKPTRQQLTFLERVATDWGGDSDEGEFKPVNNHENDHENELENELESERHCYRDYFKYHSSQGQQLWLFRDQDGKWFVHGMFN